MFSHLLHVQGGAGPCCCDRDPLTTGDVFTVGEKLIDYLFKVLISHLRSFNLFEILTNISNFTLTIKRVISLHLIFRECGVAFQVLNLRGWWGKLYTNCSLLRVYKQCFVTKMWTLSLGTLYTIHLPAGLLASFPCKLNTYRKKVDNLVTSKGLQVWMERK